MALCFKISLLHEYKIKKIILVADLNIFIKRPSIEKVHFQSLLCGGRKRQTDRQTDRQREKNTF